MIADTAELLVQARGAAGLSQDELARRAGTSRPTVSAYERGRKSPTLETLARLLSEAGFILAVEPKVEVVERDGRRGRTVVTLRNLRRLPFAQAFAKVELPIHLNWSTPGRRFDLGDRADRARVYEIVLQEGSADDILTYVDGALLIDLWSELVLPRDVRAAWSPLVESPFAAAA